MYCCGTPSSGGSCCFFWWTLWIMLIFKFTTIVRVCFHIVLIFWEKHSPPPFTLPVWPSDEMSSTACWAVDFWLMLLLVGLEMKLFICFVRPPMSKCRSAVFRCPLMTWWSRWPHYVEEKTQEKEANSICMLWLWKHKVSVCMCEPVEFCVRGHA